MGVSSSLLLLSLGRWVSQHHREQQPFIFQGSCVFRSPAAGILAIHFPQCAMSMPAEAIEPWAPQNRRGQSGSRGVRWEAGGCPPLWGCPQAPEALPAPQQHPARQELLEHLALGHGCCPHCLAMLWEPQSDRWQRLWHRRGVPCQPCAYPSLAVPDNPPHS